MRIRIMASRHSAFYSPLLASVRFLRDEGHDAPYAVLGPGQQTYVADSRRSSRYCAIRRVVELEGAGARGRADARPFRANQSARRLLSGGAREPDPAFEWKKLEGRTLVADQGDQPLAMLKYAVKHNGVDWTEDQGPAQRAKGITFISRVRLWDGRSWRRWARRCRRSRSAVYAVRAAFRGSAELATFVKVYQRAREWVRSAPAEEVAAAEAEFFPGVSHPNCWHPPSSATRISDAGTAASKSRATCTNRRSTSSSRSAGSPGGTDTKRSSRLRTPGVSNSRRVLRLLIGGIWTHAIRDRRPPVSTGPALRPTPPRAWTATRGLPQAARPPAADSRRVSRRCM